MKSVDDYMGLPYHIGLMRSADADGDTEWVAWVDELRGCASQGASPAEAVSMITEAMEGWIAAALAHGDSVPEPRAESGYSGNFVVRLPAGLHRTLDLGAKREGVSLNQYVATTLAGAIGWHQANDHPRGGARPPRARGASRTG
ncbi:MAG: toxin-antitoxin system HicB family antitoxin [Tepidiformaceae bacterium]